MVHYWNEKSENLVMVNAVFEHRKIFRSNRLDKLRTRVFETIPQIDSSRAKAVTESYKETEGQPISIRRAKALQKTLEKLPIRINEGELIVGEIGPYDRCAQVYPDYGIDWFIEELNGNPFRFENRPGDKFVINEEDERAIREIASYWRGRTHKDHVYSRIPECAWEAFEIGMIDTDYLVICAEGHVIVNLKRILEEGMESFRLRAEKVMETLDLTEPENLKKLPFLQSVLINCDSVKMFAQRYSELAMQMAKEETDEQRKAELNKISEVCARVPMKPARDFHEAIQSMYFTNLILNIEGNGSAFSYGRMDQKLYPYYKKALAEGWTENDMKELFSNLMLKMFQVTRVLDWHSTATFRGYVVAQNMTIGGQNKYGQDAANEMTYWYCQYWFTLFSQECSTLCCLL